MVDFLNFIGREKEIYDLNYYLKRTGRHLVSIIGRRGVGKTRLKNEFLEKIKDNENYLIVDLRANKNQKRKDHIIDCLFKINLQLELNLDLKHLLKDENLITHWGCFFDFLFLKIKEKLNSKKLIFVIDEFAWFQTKQSNFVEHFAVFYDYFQDINSLFVITASAVSWMNRNVLKTKGGLHSKTHFVINLKPFDFEETINFLYKINPFFTPQDYLQYYLYTGGVVRYLEKIQAEKTILENSRLLFSNSGSYNGEEFVEIFNSAFEGKNDIHLEVVKSFKEKNFLTKKELSQIIKNYSVMSISNAVDDLVVSSILSEKQNFGKEKKDKVYYVSDLFCFYCIKVFNQKTINQSLLDKSYSYNGFAFEIFTYLNSDLIKKEIFRYGFNGINEGRTYTWRNKKTQIDLIFDYGNNNFSIVECKNYSSPYTFTKNEVENLINKKQEFSKYLYSKNQRIYHIDFVIVSLNEIKINSGVINASYVVVNNIIENKIKLLK